MNLDVETRTLASLQPFRFSNQPVSYIKSATPDFRQPPSFPCAHHPMPISLKHIARSKRRKNNPSIEAHKFRV
ncbi:MAG: hypothetical protein WBF90_32620 [Rivularia sp. (in: cyanobacteria)]